MLSIPLLPELLRADFIIEVRGFLGVKDCPRHGGGNRAAQGLEKCSTANSRIYFYHLCHVLSLAACLASFDQRWDLFRRFSTSVERKKYENWGLYRLHIMFMRVSRRAHTHTYDTVTIRYGLVIMKTIYFTFSFPRQLWCDICKTRRWHSTLSSKCQACSISRQDGLRMLLRHEDKTNEGGKASTAREVSS